MTLLNAPEYDPARERRRKLRIAILIAAAIIVAMFLYLYRYWPQEHVVNKFFNDLEQQNYKQAY